MGVYDRFKATDRLPSPSGVVLEIIRLADAEETTAELLAPVVESDPAIASRLIRLANAPASGCARQVSSVRQAVMLLGLRTTKIISLGFCLVSGNRSGRCLSFDYEGFWSESVARAATVRHLCARLKGLAPDEGFTAGLLSQTGRLALASVFPERYAELLESIDKDDMRERAIAEVRAFQIHPDELTAAMIGDWGLPATFCAAVRSQEDPSQAADTESKKLAYMLSLARSLGRLMVRRSVTDDECGELDRQAIGLGLPPEELDAVLDCIASEWREAGRILDVRTRHVPRLTTILELAEERRRAAVDREVSEESESQGIVPADVSAEECERLRALSREQPSLSQRADELASRKIQIVKRHEQELAQLRGQHEAELDPVLSAYNEVLDNLLSAREASERVAALTGQPGEVG